MTPPPEQETLRVALVQLCSGRNPTKNVSVASELIRRAAADGAQYVQTPEVTNGMEVDRCALFAAAVLDRVDEALGPLLAATPDKLRD